MLLPTAQPADLLTSLSLAHAFHSVGTDFLMQMALAFHVTRAVRNVRTLPRVLLACKDYHSLDLFVQQHVLEDTIVLPMSVQTARHLAMYA